MSYKIALWVAIIIETSFIIGIGHDKNNYKELYMQSLKTNSNLSKAVSNLTDNLIHCESILYKTKEDKK